jgi:hypothetical protein
MAEPDSEIPDDILEAQADCVRRGWIRELGGGRFEITDKGRREAAQMEALAIGPPTKSRH